MPIEIIYIFISNCYNSNVRLSNTTSDSFVLRLDFSVYTNTFYLKIKTWHCLFAYVFIFVYAFYIEYTLFCELADYSHHVTYFIDFKNSSYLCVLWYSTFLVKRKNKNENDKSAFKCYRYSIKNILFMFL